MNYMVCVLILIAVEVSIKSVEHISYKDEIKRQRQ